MQAAAPSLGLSPPQSKRSISIYLLLKRNISISRTASSTARYEMSSKCCQCSHSFHGRSNHSQNPLISTRHQFSLHAFITQDNNHTWHFTWLHLRLHHFTMRQPTSLHPSCKMQLCPAQLRGEDTDEDTYT